MSGARGWASRGLGAAPASVIVALAAAGCGGLSGSAAAAHDFTRAVASGDRGQWCGQLARSVFGGPARPLRGAQLAACRRTDPFAARGACDLQRAVAGATVVSDRETSRGARVRLSTGARLELREIGGRWLVTAIVAPAHPLGGRGACR